ncbi:MAG TPA: hypothetical protein VFG18_04775 [Xanthomonadaceae bacterium]|nr:hypothetical protein [Xanthomonadaceae bacterium]
MHPFTPDDLYRHCILGGLSGSPGHQRMVFKVTRALRGEETYRSVAWGLDLARGDKPRRLTASTTSAKSPTLDPGGERLAFLASRGDGGMQVQLMTLDGGEARALTASKHRLSTIEGWSPDGRRLLLTAEVDCSEKPGEGDRDARQRTRDSASGKDAPQVARFLPYKKDGSGVIVGKRAHLFAADARSGEMAVLAEGDFDVSGAAWSPRGTRLAFVRNRSGRQRHWKDLWLADADGRHPRQRTSDLASVQKLAWSPDGRRLALIASRTEGSARTQLWLLDAEGDAAPRLLGGDDFELASASSIVWHPDGRRLALITVHRGLQPLAIVDADSGAVTRLRDGLRQAFGLAPCGDRLVYSATSMRWTDELYSVSWEGGDARRHGAFNRKWFRRRARPQVRKRRFAVPDGNGGREKIDAWLLLPPHGRPPYPLLVDAHGGPQSGVLADFAMHTYWYPLLSDGWAVLAPNAVGSSGYGADFARRICGHWGELDFP